MCGHRYMAQLDILIGVLFRLFACFQWHSGTRNETIAFHVPLISMPFFFVATSSMQLSTWHSHCLMSAPTPGTSRQHTSLDHRTGAGSAPSRAVLRSCLRLVGDLASLGIDTHSIPSPFSRVPPLTAYPSSQILPILPPRL